MLGKDVSLFENWILENFFLYFWLVKIQLSLKCEFGGCGQGCDGLGGFDWFGGFRF